jgi:hypothetical protein
MKVVLSIVKVALDERPKCVNCCCIIDWVQVGGCLSWLWGVQTLGVALVRGVRHKPTHVAAECLFILVILDTCTTSPHQRTHPPHDMINTQVVLVFYRCAGVPSRK